MCQIKIYSYDQSQNKKKYLISLKTNYHMYIETE